MEAAAGSDGKGSSEEEENAGKTKGSAITEAEQRSASLKENITLWEEVAVRTEVRQSPLSGNFVGVFCISYFDGILDQFRVPPFDCLECWNDDL